MKNIIKEQIWQRVIQTFTATIPASGERVISQNELVVFNQRMVGFLPRIKEFFSWQLSKLEKNNIIPGGKYKAEDLVDDLYIMAYDHNQKVKGDVHLFNWLFAKAKELIEDTIIEVDFDNTFFKNIDNYTKVERDEMEERFSVDGDGDLVMEEELDDLSYRKNDYVLESAFIQSTNYEA